MYAIRASDRPRAAQSDRGFGSARYVSIGPFGASAQGARTRDEGHELGARPPSHGCSPRRLSAAKVGRHPGSPTRRKRLERLLSAAASRGRRRACRDRRLLAGPCRLAVAGAGGGPGPDGGVLSLRLARLAAGPGIRARAAIAGGAVYGRRSAGDDAGRRDPPRRPGQGGASLRRPRGAIERPLQRGVGVDAGAGGALSRGAAAGAGAAPRGAAARAIGRGSAAGGLSRHRRSRPRARLRAASGAAPCNSVARGAAGTGRGSQTGRRRGRAAQRHGGPPAVMARLPESPDRPAGGDQPGAAVRLAAQRCAGAGQGV